MDPTPAPGPGSGRPGGTLLDLVRDGALHEAGERAVSTQDFVALGAVRLLPPLQAPTVRDFVAFAEHVEGVRRSVDGADGVVPEWYEAPAFYFTNPHALIGAHDEVPVPPGCEVLDFELEVAAVIGRDGANLSPEQARSHIAGYAVLNDWSARDLQRREMRVGDHVARLPPLGLGDHDPAVAQAGQVVRHVRARQLQLAREHGRVA